MRGEPPAVIRPAPSHRKALPGASRRYSGRVMLFKSRRFGPKRRARIPESALAEAGFSNRFLSRTTRFAHRSAWCCPILCPIAVTEIFVFCFNGLRKCRNSKVRDICATFARKQPQLAPNRAVFCCVIGGLLSHMELRRRGASRGRPVLGGSLKSLAFMRVCPKTRSD